jgi:hypothetical protein
MDAIFFYLQGDIWIFLILIQSHKKAEEENSKFFIYTWIICEFFPV